MDGRLILENILDGKTAMGTDMPASGRAPITFTGTTAMHMALYAALDLSSRIFADVACVPDRTFAAFPFTTFARKLIVFVQESGVQQERPSFLTRVAHAADLATQRVDLLSTNVAFASLVELGLAMKARSPDPEGEPIRTPLHLTRADEIEMMRAKAQPTSPDVHWRSDDGAISLYELAHPFHLWEEGMRLNNCLTRIHPHYPSTAVRGYDSSARLSQLHYWKLVSNKTLRIFSLRRGDTTAAAFSIAGTALRELALHLPVTQDIWMAFADVIDLFDDELGPLTYSPHHHSQAINTLLRYVARERTRRGRRPSLTPEANA